MQPAQPARHRRIVIFGPPGTGKTTKLRGMIREYAESYGAESILATSFTKTAALNIISPRPGEAPLPIPVTHANTMHAICFAVLHLKKKQMTASHINEFTALHTQFGVSETFKRTMNLEEPEYDPSAETLGDEVFARYNLMRNMLTPRAEWSTEILKFAEKWEAWKAENEYFDFADLIERCLNDHWHHIPYACKVLFGDEFQDFTPLSHALFEKWARDAEIAISAGDDDQLIFGYTGANVSALLAHDAEPENVIVLPDSRRVPVRVQMIANAWINGVSQRQPKVYNPREALGTVRFNNGKYTQPDLVVNDVLRQAQAAKSSMILASCSYMLNPTLHALRAAGIPFHNPYRPTRGDWNPLDTRGYSMADRIARLIGYEAQEWTWRDLDAIVTVLPHEGITTRGAKAEIDGRAHDKIVGDCVVPVDDLTKLLTPESFVELITGNVDYFVANLLPDYKSKAAYPLAIMANFGPQALTTPPLVCVGTIHSVKGAEADNVYLYPDLSKTAARAQSNGISGTDAVIRQFYVGITRARETLILCNPNGKDFAKIPAAAAFTKGTKAA